MITDQSPLEGAMIIEPGDLFGLLDILELAESGYIRRDALFATTPRGIIIELNSSYETAARNKRRRLRSRSGSRSRTESVASDSASIDTSRKGRRSSIASAASSGSSLSLREDADTESVFSSTSSYSSHSSLSTTTSPFPSPSLPKSNSKPKSPSNSHNPINKSSSSSSLPSTFTYYSPTTHLPTTINPSHPEDVPPSVASEAITALIGKLDDLMAAKAGTKSVPMSTTSMDKGFGALSIPPGRIGVC